MDVLIPIFLFIKITVASFNIFTINEWWTQKLHTRTLRFTFCTPTSKHHLIILMNMTNPNYSRLKTHKAILSSMFFHFVTLITSLSVLFFLFLSTILPRRNRLSHRPNINPTCSCCIFCQF